jgi:lysine-specific demethylase 8
LDLPGLQAAVPPLEHYKGPRGDVYGRTLWVGPKGSFTPFHRDPNVGLYTQVAGGKVFHLVPPEVRFATSAVRNNTATVPVSVRRILDGEGEGEGEELPRAEREEYRALLDDAFARDGACEVRLGPGDSVLIPPGWWHSAEGESVGVGVNAWFR